MRSLSPPPWEPIRVYDGITDLRKLNAVKEVLRQVRAQVLSAYPVYASRDAEELVQIVPLNLATDEAKALYSNYKTFRDVEEVMYDRLVLSTPICPMCAERDPTTVDHALPRKNWPEFSILPENLVPTCDVCNRRKRDWVVNENGEPLFIHPYRDDPDELEFLDAAVDTSSGTAVVQFFIRSPAGDDAQLLARIARHYEKLKLAELYRVKAIPEIQQNTLAVARMLEDGVTIHAVRRSLQTQAEITAKVRGKNHWRSVLHRRLAGNDDFVAGACSPGLPGI